MPIYALLVDRWAPQGPWFLGGSGYATTSPDGARKFNLPADALAIEGATEADVVGLCKGDHWEGAKAGESPAPAPPRYVLESWVGGAWQRSVHYPDVYPRDYAERIAKARSGYRAVPETNGEANPQ